MVVVLLPGMDGAGILFKEFVGLLPDGIEARIVRYPEDRYLTYRQLAGQVIAVIPVHEPHTIVAESYSGPVAALLAARPAGNLR